jgi:penicillin-binding protein 1A
LVGGRDYGDSKYNRALFSQRQVGSTFKPFVYAAAFQHGLLPGASIDDGRIQRGEVRGAANWTPDNSDNTYKGMQRAEEGLIQSRNTMSVRVGQAAGLDAVQKIGVSAGLNDIPKQPAIYLGAFESSLLQMTSAYTVFPNNGMRRQTYIIERIDDASGEMIYRAAHVHAPAIDPGVAWLTGSVMSKVLERGTAASAKSMGWNRPAAGKTGTTNDFRDAWFIGYTGTLTAGVWVGFDKPQTIMARGYGAALALPIWVDIMNSASGQRYPAPPLKPPMQLQHVNVCAASSELATSGCDRSGEAYGIDLPPSLVPRDPCHVHRGGVMTDSNRDQRPSAPESIFRSFRRFFGGKE